MRQVIRQDVVRIGDVVKVEGFQGAGRIEQRLRWSR